MTSFRPKLIAFMNSYSQGKSGGDMVFIEIAKRIKSFEKVIITSYLGKKLCQENGIEAKYLVTTKEFEFKNVILTYLQRTIKAFFFDFKVKKNNVLLGTSDFLSDVLPIFWLKIKNPKVKWIQHIFHLIPSLRKISYFAQKISFLLIKNRADLIIVDNSLLKKELVKLGFNKKKIEVNYPGIKLEYLKKIKPAKRGYEGIFMAQLRPSKGIFDLIKIWKLVCREKPEARLGVIGKGEKKIMEEIKTKVENAGLKRNIKLLGFLEDDKALGTIKASQVFVFPSREEGFGIAPLEAQALGLPAVAWNLPVFDEVFPKGMIKLKMGQIEEFAEEVINLLNNKNFYQKLSKEAKGNAGKYNWEKSAEREILLMKRIMRL